LSTYKIELSSYSSEGINFELEPLILNNFNLRVGSPYTLEIEAANEETTVLEVYYPNSIIYVAFAIESKDINFEISRYEQDIHFDSIHNKLSDKEENEKLNDKFHSIIKVEYLSHSSIPVKVKINPNKQ
jgi:hypothetical protein